MTTRPGAVRVSQATRLKESSVRQASRIASETWSAILSGWPSVTDSEVNKKRSLKLELLPIEGTERFWPAATISREFYKRPRKPNPALPILTHLPDRLPASVDMPAPAGL